MGKFFGMIKNLGMALAIGLVVGVVSVLFNLVIEGGVELSKVILLNQKNYYFLLPFTGAMLTMGIYGLYLKDDHTGLGIVQVLIELEQIKTHLMLPFRVFIRVVSAMITLIFGFSAGRFGPIVHLGAAVGSNAGYYMKLSSSHVRLLIGCGAAAAIAAVFKMPLFAAVFVLEVLYKKQFANYFAPVVLSAVVANLLGNYFQGPMPVFDFAYEQGFVLNDLLVFTGFGLLMGVVGILYILSINNFTELFGKLGNVYIRLAVGGLIIAVIGLFFSLNFELHENTTSRIMSGEFEIGVLVAIGFVKMIATGITLGSGFVGGNFYPGITIGAGIGMAFGKIIEPAGENQIFGVLGMGALISSYLNAPIAGIVWILEYSRHFDWMIPALIVCSMSVSVTYHLLGKDIFTKTYESAIDQMRLG
ncbi:MAG: chloride channel protein [Clostridia bacterium]|nr:chloride channel protein [Clostridia bacterium]